MFFCFFYTLFFRSFRSVCRHQLLSHLTFLSLSFSNSLPWFPHFLQLFLTWACRLFLPITYLSWLSPLFSLLIIGVLSAVLLSNEPKDRFVLKAQNLMMSSLMITSMTSYCRRKIKKWRGCLIWCVNSHSSHKHTDSFFYLICFDVFSKCNERAVKPTALRKWRIETVADVKTWKGTKREMEREKDRLQETSAGLK